MKHLQKRAKRHRINDNITYAFLAHAVSAATQFIVCSVGIGDVPQQAKLQGVYHLALLATLLQHLHPTIIKALILLEC